MAKYRKQPGTPTYHSTSTRKGQQAKPSVTRTMRIPAEIELPNHLAPYLARIAMEQDKTIRMRVARSDADGYTTAVLR